MIRVIARHFPLLGLAARGLREQAVRVGLLRRVTPIGKCFGIDRGGPIDRYYIDGFIERHRHEIRGVVLEAGGFSSYTKRFGEDRRDARRNSLREGRIC